MNRGTKKPTSLRDSWRPRDRRGAYAALKRALFKYGTLLLLLVLIGGFFYLLTSPFLHPRTHLACLIAGEAADPASRNLPTLHSAPKDSTALLTHPVAAWTPLVHEQNDKSPLNLAVPKNVYALRTVADLASFSEELSQQSLGMDDVLVVYLIAHGIAQEGEAYLLCQDFNVQSETAGRYPLDKFLQQLRDCDAGTKLLCIDNGQMDFDPRLGIVVNEFPRLLENAVLRLNDRKLWVLTACSELQHTWSLAGDSQSVFGQALSKSFSLQADVNSDRVIDLGELYRFVSHYVKQSVSIASGSYVEQTPRLYNSQPLAPRPVAPHPSASTRVHYDWPVIASISYDPLAISTPADGNQDATENNPKPADAAPEAKEQSAASTTAKPAGEPTNVTNGTAPDSNTPDAPSGDANANVTSISTNGANARKLSNETPPTLPNIKPIEDLNTPAESLLRLAWQLKDYAEWRSSKEDNIIDHYPQQWRTFVDMLLSWDQALRNDSNQATDIAKPLRAELLGLYQLLTKQPLNSGSVMTPIASEQLSLANATTSVRSIGLAEAFDRDNFQSMDIELRQFITRFDAALLEDDPQVLQKLFDEVKATPRKKWLDQYLEIWLADRLLQQQASWRLTQTVLQTTRLSERLYADPCAQHPVIQDQLAQADRLRLKGLRALLDQIGERWDVLAERTLSDAVGNYQVAKGQIDILHHAIRSRNDFLFTAPEHIRLCEQLAGFPEAVDYGGQLIEALRVVRQLNEKLIELDRANLDEVSELSWRLEAIKQQIADSWALRKKEVLSSAVADSRTMWQVSLLLNTSLLHAQERRQLNDLIQQRADTLEKRLPPIDDVTISSGLGSDVWRNVELHWQMAAGLAQLGGFNAASSVAAELPADAVIQKRYEAYRKGGNALRSFYNGLPGQIRSYLQGFSAELSREDRLNLVRGLRQADISLRLSDSRDRAQTLELNPRALLQRIQLYETLLQLRERNQKSTRDATEFELAFYRQTNNELRSMANTLFAQPGVTPFPADTLQWLGSNQVNLVRDREREVSLQLQIRGLSQAATWIVLDYDPRYLQVEINPKEGIQLRKDLSSSSYPETPDPSQATSTLNLAADSLHELLVKVRRTDRMAGQTRLIIKAINGDSYVRHTIDVQLPSEAQVRLLADAPAGSVTETPEGLTLHPWPNRESTFRLSMATEGEQIEKVVDVEIRQLSEHRSVNLLAGAVPEAAANKVLDLLGPSQVLKRLENVVVPAGGTPVALPLMNPINPNAPNSNALAGSPNPPTSSETPAPISVRFGLLFVIRDRASGNTVFRRIDFRPRRPRSYVRPQVGYDPTRQRLTVQLNAIDPRVIPAKGIPIRGEFATSMPQVEAQLATSLSTTQPSASMSALIPPDAISPLRLYLHVDGFPRAFVFDIPLSFASQALPESSDILAARITQPRIESAYSAPVDHIPVELQIDTPPGAFENGKGTVEIGIDVNRDREFANESTLQLFADRQADIHILQWGTQGELHLVTDVRDFQLQLPGHGIRNTRANLLALVRVGRLSAYSDPLEIVLDATPPVIMDARVEPTGVAEIGKPLRVAATAEDDGLSGVNLVEVGIDIDGKGEFSEAAPPLKATRSAEGQWIAELPTATLQAGRTSLLVRATDKVGNVGPYFSYPIEVETAEMVADKALNTPNRVSGSVSYESSLIPNAEIALLDEKGVKVAITKSNQQGFFRFSAVKPGKYKVTANGLWKNRPRLAETVINVEAPPKPAVRVDLKCR